MMKKHLLQLILVTIVTTISMSTTVHASGWQQNAVGWWWQNDDGSWFSNSWQWLDGNKDGVAECYYFNSDGYMLSNIRTPDNYDVNADGAWIVNGVVQTRLQNQGQVSQNGWNKENNFWKYYVNSKAVTGWRQVDGKQYCFDDNGIMLTGFYIIDDNLYYFNPSGDLQTDSFNRNSIHYEVNNDGVITSRQNEEEWEYESKTPSQGNNHSFDKMDSFINNQSSNVNTSNYAKEVFDLVNQERRKAGKSALEWDDRIAFCADIRAQELTEAFSHTRPNGTNCFTILDEYNVSAGYKGENIAAGQFTPAQVMDSWMNSSGHRANILSSDFTKLGVGFYQGSDIYKYYWVQMFSD